MRVLVLHGFTQNSFIIQKRLSAIKNLCGKKVEWVFIDGPHILTLADSRPYSNAVLDSLETEGEPTDPRFIPRAWWRFESYTKYTGWDETAAYLRDFFVSQEEPFNAVLGFSQGAVLTSILTAAFERPAEAAKIGLHHNGKPLNPPLDFSVMVAGFLPKDPLVYHVVNEAPHPKTGKPGIHTRSLHISGETDVIATPATIAEFASVFHDKRVERHDGGHHIPGSSGWRKLLKTYLTTLDDEQARDIPSPEEALPVDLELHLNGGVPFGAEGAELPPSSETVAVTA